MLKEFVLAFIPVFVAVDVIGLIPIFISLTRKLNAEEIKKTLIQSFITGISLALVFIFVGKWIFAVLGITVNDFMVAGGVILFLIALRDIFNISKHVGEASEMGAVPIGTPLIVGPGVLTTCLILTAQYGIIPTITSVVINVLIAVLVLSFSRALIKLIGNTGVLAVSRIMALLLAAIAVMMIRKGLAGMFM